MSTNSKNFLCASCLNFESRNYLKNMNISQRYVRMFPILLGSTRSQIPKSSVFNFFKNFSTKSEIDSLNKLEANPYFSKYVKKIKDLEKSDPIEFRKRLKALDELHNKTIQENKNKKLNSTNLNSSQATKNITNSGDINQTRKGLDSILKLELIENLPKHEIEKLWVGHYAEKDAVCATIPSETYNNISTLANQYPVFVYPVPRKDGYEIFVGQFSDNSFHFTSLLNYQKHKENSPSQLSLNHYVELQDKKDLVLMSGMLIEEGLNVTDAQLLSYLVQHFHIEHSNLIRDFTESPDQFDVSHVISSIDNNLLSMATGANK